MMSKPPALRLLLATLVAVILMWTVSASLVLASGPFGVAKFEAAITTENGEPAGQAGSHPYEMSTKVVFESGPPTPAQEIEGFGGTIPNGDTRNVKVNLPVGVVVDPAATSQKCTEGQLESEVGCPAAAAVGVVTVKSDLLDGAEGTNALYNMVPPSGRPAEFAFDALGLPGLYVHLFGEVRTGTDYGLSADIAEITQKAGVSSAAVTLWGYPAAESHDEERGLCAEVTPEKREEEREIFDQRTKEALEDNESLPRESEYYLSCPVERTGKSFLTMPISCTGAPLTATISADSWQESQFREGPAARLATVVECDKLKFAPTLSIRPTETPTTTESPVGFEVNLRLPQEESRSNLAESDLKEAVVMLPPSLDVSPSAANGLEPCALLRGREPTKEEEESQGRFVGINLESNQEANCPAESKVGSVEVITPLLETPLKGSVYLAQQGNLAGNGINPFKSLFALYVVAEGSGVTVKLPGELKLSKNGQLSAKFGENPTTGFDLPQLPFSELKMRFFGGPRAPLVTPSTCGTYTTTSLLTPYGSEANPLTEPLNPAAEPDSTFEITSNCAPHPFSPTLTAGTINPQAGGYTDETVTIARQNGEQHLSGVTITTPPGLLGMLSKVPLCGEQQANEGTCGAESQIGETTVAVGPGEDPYWVKGGHVYLTGPYNHQPFGLSIVVPTTAGPFTLKGEHPGVFGKEVVRASIAVNPKTGAITIASDPLPQMLEGVPLDIRTINVNINRGEFAFNPTNCEELHVTSSMTSAEGATATPASRFEAANCAALPFRPTFQASTQGHSSDRGNGASLNVKVTQKPGEAAIRSVHLELPKKLPARLSTLQKACPEATFYANPANCPASSDVGTAVAHTPVLPVPLEGPAYFVSHGGAQYPELVFVLQGDGVTIQLAGETHIDSRTKITTSTFGTVPDAPITSFEANLPEKPNSALGSLTPKGLCVYNTEHLSMPTTIVGQNGARVTQTTKVAITGCPKKAPKHKRHHKAKRKPATTKR